MNFLCMRLYFLQYTIKCRHNMKLLQCVGKKLIQAFKKFHKKELYGVKQSQEPQSLKFKNRKNSKFFINVEFL